MSYETIIADRKNKYVNAGLTSDEIELLTTPLSALNPNLRTMAFAVREKYDEEVKKRNTEKREIEKEEKASKPFAERIGTPVVRAETVL